MKFDLKRSCHIITAIIAVTIVFGGYRSSAMTYQDKTDVQFTFNPVVTIELSGDLIIPDLAPGTSSDSNIITVVAGTNDLHGYTLHSTVGNASNNYTDLRLDNNDAANKFTNLTTNRTSLSDFTDNEWGYSYSNDGGTTWISGDVDNSTSGYAGLPLFNDANAAAGVKLADTNGPTQTNLKVKIGAKASPGQPAGTYTNIVNFIGVAKVIATNYTVDYIDVHGWALIMPEQQTGVTNNAIITLSNIVPRKHGYVFNGWCDVITIDDACSGTTYDPGDIYIINNPYQTATIGLYAMWAIDTP